MQYTKTIQNLNTLQIKETLELLIMTDLVIPVTHTFANGIPLGAEMNFKKERCYCWIQVYFNG